MECGVDPQFAADLYRERGVEVVREQVRARGGAGLSASTRTAWRQCCARKKEEVLGLCPERQVSFSAFLYSFSFLFFLFAIILAC